MKTSTSLPLVEELRPAPQPESLFLRLCHLPHCLFLDSAQYHPELGRNSFLTADPFDYWQRRPDDVDSLGELSERLSRFPTKPVLGLPPFQGGAAGLLGYELGRQLEQLPANTFDEFQVPALAVGLYDVVVAFDHAEQRAWLISQGLPETEPSARYRRAQQRLALFRGYLMASEPSSPPRLSSASQSPDVPLAEFSPQYAVAGLTGLRSNFSETAYLNAVQQAIDYIYAGDVFQVNLSQRLLYPAQDDSVSLYRRLRQCNPAPFAGYFDLGDFQVISASPERFLQVADRWVETRPIKGTCPRTSHAETDRRAADALCHSEKDRAENVMIVDLLRNDLARVCRPESVQVSQLCGLEQYQYVQHLVSVVRGQLAEHTSAVDLIRAAFPGGSITGAPKVRAMEIITELERTARGVYCGSLGYLGFDGSLDLSILIRTITAGRGWWQAPVGGGIVAPSIPRREYEETWHKAEGLLRAFQSRIP